MRAPARPDVSAARPRPPAAAVLRPRSGGGTRLAAITLGLGAAAFAGAGLAFAAAPDLVRLVGLAPDTATARSDVRAIFGGLELGVAALLVACARRPDWHAVGLLAQALAFGGLAAGRLLSLAADGTPAGITFMLWGPELVGAALATVAFRRLTRARHAPNA
jgi:hypothetical protein